MFFGTFHKALKKTDQEFSKTNLQSILSVFIKPLPITALIAADNIYCCYCML